MKRTSISAKLSSDFPRTKAQIATAIARAPKSVPYDPETDPYDPNDPAAVAAFWKNAVATRGGPKAIREALAAKRRRGPGKKPAKTLLTLRIAPAVIERWKATGPGWQTRMVERLSVAPRR